MNEFRQGLEEMGVDTSDDPYLNLYAPKTGERGGSRSGSRGGDKPLTRGTLTRSRELSILKGALQKPSQGAHA